MFFTGPIWLSILIPIVFAPFLLIVSLLVSPDRGVFDKSVLLSATGVALAYLTGGPLFTAVLVGFVLFTHWIAIAIERAGNPRRQAWLLVAVAAHVAMVAAILRGGLIAGPLEHVPGMLVPFGVSYFAFHGIAYLVDVYRRAAANRSPSQLGVHLLFLPMIVGGPVAYRGVTPYLAHGWPSLSDYSYGVRRLLIGAWKVFVMADLAGRQADIAFALRPAQLSASMAWLGLASLTVQMYYGFSGYADMGIGFGRMLGVRLPENFRWPYVGQTLRDFWHRWHLGLSAWFREYADLPGDGKGARGSILREALSVLLCGIWYGAGWTFAVWGLFHAVLIVLERCGLEAAVKRLPAALRHAYVMALVIAGWVILRSETLSSAQVFFKALAGLNASTLRGRPAVPIELWWVLAAGAIGCAPVFQAVRRWTVAIDAVILSLLMLLFAPVLFAWRCGSIVATPVLRRIRR
ncbi:MAG TPA: MBOAT family O-acyltransferase [Vicinamibacterales bacterium]|nr:MBOAT family O-acyltransferase [Vicinamibacterales bacterium]